MSNEYIFGYGSLVNLATHDYTSHPARLTGWRRKWSHTSTGPSAYLSVVRDEASVIDGIVMQVSHGDPNLEKREAAYVRYKVTDLVDHDRGSFADIQVYAVPYDKTAAPELRHPIWLSYLDVVVQGFHNIGGSNGVQHFFETTDGWDTPIIDDRARPSYPRHQKLSLVETELTDEWLRQLSAVVKKL